MPAFFDLPWMGDRNIFVVRTLPGQGREPLGLDGAFRVHISQDDLERMNLKTGDVCQITREDGTSGYGLAWRALDKMGNSPKNRAVKMSETLLTSFGLEAGTQVTISKGEAPVAEAKKVLLTEVMSPGSEDLDSENYRWKRRCASILGLAEVIAGGISFDVKVKQNVKKRFFVEDIEAISPGGPSLFWCSDDTEFEILDKPPPKNVVKPQELIRLDTDRLAGLAREIEELNLRLRDLTYAAQTSNKELTRDFSEGILLHGYEGTGKSALLNELSKSTACSVLRLSKSDLGGTISRNRETIETVFNDALSRKPSLLLIDEIDRISSPEDETYQYVLADGLDRIQDSSVLVVATARQQNGLHSSLLKPGRLGQVMELPIPETAARVAILKLLCGLPAETQGDATSLSIARRTHGFTGQDLQKLVRAAKRHARRDFKPTPQPNQLPSESEIPVTDGAAHSQAVGIVENGQHFELLPPPPTLADFEEALAYVQPTALREVFLETPKVHWSDIGGSGSMKSRFDEIIGWPLYHAEILAEYRKKPQKGVLLYGPPGCSKTLTAQAVATTYEYNFIAVKGAELLSMYVGESERAVRDVFRKARAASPCIIFFDEIDAIGAERESGGAKGLNVLTTLLNEMDGFEQLKHVTVLAATNKPEVLDPALMRPGRFDSHVYVGPPGSDARKEIFDICLKNLPIGEDVDLEVLVGNTGGYSGAEIVRICDLAEGEAVRERIAGGKGLVTGEYFDRALDEVRKGITEEMLEGYEKFGAKGAQ
ncbi:hypothetical protein MBLNU230_g5373t1 [Neophaeotheca triangularis]